MQDRQSVVIVIDPSQESHPALERALAMAAHSNDSSHIQYVFLLTATPEQGKSPSYFACSDSWVNEQIYDRMKSIDIPFSIMVAWSNDWKDVVLGSSKEHSAIMTIVPFYGKVKDHFLSDEKWKLLRQSENPVLIASHVEREFSGKILCSLKTQDSKYSDRNQTVMESARRFAEVFNLEIHIVNAYTDSMDYPDRGKIAANNDIDNERIHVKNGEPEDVICNTANDMDAGLVLIASQRRTGLQGALRGNTVEKIIERVQRDVLVI